MTLVLFPADGKCDIDAMRTPCVRTPQTVPGFNENKVDDLWPAA